MISAFSTAIASLAFASFFSSFNLFASTAKTKITNDDKKLIADKKELTASNPDNKTSDKVEKSKTTQKLVKGMKGSSDVSEVKYKSYSKPMKLFPFEVKNTNGKIVSQDTLQGRWSLITFGFTRCPDICPMTMSRLKRELEKLPAGSKDKIVVYFATLDPDADKPELLEKYLDSWKIKFPIIGLVESKQVMRKFASQFSPVSESKLQDDGKSKAPNILHTGLIFVINPSGEMEGYFSESEQGEQIAATMAKLAR